MNLELINETQTHKNRTDDSSIYTDFNQNKYNFGLTGLHAPPAMSVCLHIILTRNVPVGDLIAVADTLKKPLLKRVEGGIDLSHTKAEYRDLRIVHVGKTRRVDYSEPTAIMLHAEPGVTQWHSTKLEFRVRSAGAVPFAIDEVLPIMTAVCAQFDARPALVENRRELKLGSPLPTHADTTETINDFYGYDVAKAIKTFTMGRPEYPGVVNERLFRCWRCANMYPAGSFDPLGLDLNIDPFYWMLGNHVAGKVPACVVCCDELTVRPATPLTRDMKAAYDSGGTKRLKSDGV